MCYLWREHSVDDRQHMHGHNQSDISNAHRCNLLSKTTRFCAGHETRPVEGPMTCSSATPASRRPTSRCGCSGSCVAMASAPSWMRPTCAYGDAADAEMEAALRSCSIVVFVLTPDFARSSYCMKELCCYIGRCRTPSQPLRCAAGNTVCWKHSPLSTHHAAQQLLQCTTTSKRKRDIEPDCREQGLSSAARRLAPANQSSSVLPQCYTTPATRVNASSAASRT